MDPYVMVKTRVAYVEILGIIWMPAVEASQTIVLHDHDLANIEVFDRQHVEQWVLTHSGDFQSITDFRAVCGAEVIEWLHDDSADRCAACDWSMDPGGSELD